jgi:PEP-CTERM motif
LLGENRISKGVPSVRYIASILLAALAVLTMASGDAFAGVVAVPEPGTLALLAAGFGAFAAVKYFGRR